MNNTVIASRPFDLLNDSIGKPVLVKLKGDRSFRGTLKAFDVHMNIVLENAEELENNETKTKFGKVILRGDNVILISP
jgi:small nuclear ribonucleoprotein (snRNP)-like protein